MQSPTNSRAQSPLPSNQEMPVTKYNQRFLDSNPSKEQEETVHFWDWVTFEKGSDYILGHYQGVNGLGLQVIKKSEESKKYLPFGFFAIIPLSQSTHQSQVTYSSAFYLMHVETGLYLGSVLNEVSKQTVFDHITLKAGREESCVFKFRKEMKGGKSVEQGSNGGGYDLVEYSNGSELSHEFVYLNSSLRIFNTLTSKYIELVKIELNSTGNRLLSPARDKSAKEPSPLQAQQAQPRRMQPNHSQYCSSIWLSQNFDYFIIRLQRRSREYNPVLLSNYDTVMIYNQFTSAYIGVRKRRQLVEVTNRHKEQSYAEQEVRKSANSHQKSHDDKLYDDSANSCKIQVNANYLSAKNCLVEQTPASQFENKHTLSYLWKVFTRPYHKVISLGDRYKNALSHPSLIKSKQVLYFQHLETGLFMMKNENENDSGQTYILCEDFEEVEEEKDETGRFAFRVQNLCVLRYDTEFVMNRQSQRRDNTVNPSQQATNTQLTAHLQPINISLPITIDFDEQQFVMSKLPISPRINYFTYHLGPFLTSLISFLNNPKAIDDRIYLLKEKLTLMEMVYEKILTEGFAQIVAEIDKGYYFLESTMKILKIVRLKMKHFQLEALNIKNARNHHVNQPNANKKKTHTHLAQQKPFQSPPTQHPATPGHYTFHNTLHPFEQLLELNTSIFTVLKPLIHKILHFLALLFASQHIDIFSLINETHPPDLTHTRAQHMTRSGDKHFQDSQQYDTKSIVMRKKNNLSGSGMSKKWSRSNSSSSFKSNASLNSNLMESTFKNLKSSIKNQKNLSNWPLSSEYQWNDKQSFTSELLKQLIKSLVHMLQIAPTASSQILKLLATEQPYEIIAQINAKLQKLQQRQQQLNNPSQGNKYLGYEPVSQVVIGTTLRLHKQFESAIHQEMYHCIKLVNHIIQYFNDDLEYDWSKKIKYVQDSFTVKTNYTRDKKLQPRQTPARDSQLAVQYKKRWYKMSQVLGKTQKTNFIKIYKIAKEKIKHQNDTHRNNKTFKKTFKSLAKQKSYHKLASNINAKSRGSLSGQKDQLLRKNSDDISSLSEGTIFNANFPSFFTTHKLNKAKFLSGKDLTAVKHSKTEMTLVEEEPNFLFECLKQVIKLKVINLKSRSLPLMEILPQTDAQSDSSQNIFASYKELPSLAFVLQIANNIEMSVLKNLPFSSESMGTVNISLLNNSRYIYCDFRPISEHTNLFKVLNFQAVTSEQSMEFKDCPIFFKEQTVEYLITQSPFGYESLDVIFKVYINCHRKHQQNGSKQVQILSQAMEGLKVLLTSLEIYVSVGKWSFGVLKKVEKYLLKICGLVVDYEESKSKGQAKSNNHVAHGNNSKQQTQPTRANEQSANKEITPSQQPTPPIHQITSGIKDTMQSMMIELNQIMEILYIQKKRIVKFPYITDPTQFFEGEYFAAQYGKLIRASSSLVKEMPILTEMFQLASSLAQSVALVRIGLHSLSSPHSPSPNQPYSPPFLQKPLNTLTITKPSSPLTSEQNSTLLTWPYLSPQQILTFVPKELTLYQQTFTKTSSTIVKLNELTLLLNTLQSLQDDQRIKNSLIIEVKEKIAAIAVNLRGLVKLEGSKKIIKAFGLVEMVLAIVLENEVLEKNAIKPLLEFLIEIKMWHLTLREVVRVLIKGGISSQSHMYNKNNDLQTPPSSAFFLSNIKKQQFFVIVAKYLQQKSPQDQRPLITDLLASNLTQILDFNQTQPYQVFMEKLSFACMLVEINPSPQTSRKIINKLLNREDVQLYIEALKTFRNFQYFCQNVKNIKFLIQSKKIIRETIYNQNHNTQNLSESRTPKNSSIFSHSSNLKPKKLPNQINNDKQQMTNEKRQEINKFVLMMTTLFRICKSDRQLVQQYMALFLSFKEFLKILKSNITSLGNSYELLKPLLVYLECNMAVFAFDQSQAINSSLKVGFNSSDWSGNRGICHQNQIFSYLQPLNDILAQYHLHIDELDSYQSTSTFFLPFVEEEQNANQYEHAVISKDKVKKIASEIKNFNKKNYFWELLLWVPCYQKEEGLLVIVEKILLKNLELFVTETLLEPKKSHKSYVSDCLQKLEPPLNRVLHGIYDNLASIQVFLQSYKSSRFSRLHTRIGKLKRIFIQIFPTIQSSLMNLKSQKIKQIKEKQQMADSHVIEEEDEDSFGFISDQKNPKSQLSYFDRLDSFQSMNLKEKNQQLTRKIVMHQARSTQLQRTQMTKEKQKEDRDNAEMIGYQFVTKLSSNEKLQKFIKTFQQNENKRQAMLLEEWNRRRSDVGSIQEAIEQQDAKNRFGIELDDESEDCVIDVEGSSNVEKSEKVKERENSSTMKKLGAKVKFEAKEKRSKSQINEMESMSNVSNYTHHAIIVAQNSLQQDMPVHKNQDASSRVTSQANRRKKFLTKVAFDPMISIKDFKRRDYSNFYERLKSYKYYEVMGLVKRVIFGEGLDSFDQGEWDKENELYYELERYLLDFYRCNGTVRQLFASIQTYLKLEAQRLVKTEADYRPGCETQNISNKFSLGLRKSITDQSAPFLNKMNQPGSTHKINQPGSTHKINQPGSTHKTQPQKHNQFNPQILFLLFNRQKYDIVDNMLKKYMLKVTSKAQPLGEKGQSSHLLSHTSHQLKTLVDFLVQCLQKDNYKENEWIEFGLMRKETGSKVDKKKVKEKNIFQSQKICFTSPNLASGYCPPCQKISEAINAAKKSPNVWPHFEQHLTESLKRKLFKLKIISRLIVILNQELTNSTPQTSTTSLQNIQLDQIQQNLNCYIYELIESLIPMLANRELNRSRSTIDSAAVLEYELKITLTRHLLQFVSFINLSPMNSEDLSTLTPKHQPNISNMISQIVSFSLGQSYRQLVLCKNLFQQPIKSKPAKGSEESSSLKIGSICLLKEFLTTMENHFKTHSCIAPSSFIHSTLVFSQDVIVGSLNYSMKLDLTSSNVESLQIISLLTSSFTFLQIFLSSINTIKVFYNTQLRQYFFRFYFSNSQSRWGDIQSRWGDIDFNAQLMAKIIQFQIYLYEILFKNKFGKFAAYSHTFYLRHMLKSYESQGQNNDDLGGMNEEEKSKSERYAVLMQLLMDSLNFMHQIYFKINSFPQFQTNLFEQRRLVIEHDSRLKLKADQTKQIYEHLQSIMGIVVISPQKKQSKNQLQVATFPTFKQFKFVWKFSLIKLSQTFIDETIRRKLVYGATKIFMQQSNKSRNIKYQLTKIGWLIRGTCEGMTVLMILCQFFLPDQAWRGIVLDCLMVFNICFLIAIMVEKLFPAIVMSQISAYLTQVKFSQSAIGVFFIYIPIIIAIACNIYAFWEKKAILLVMLVFLFNRFQFAYAFLQQHYKSVKAIFLYLVRTVIMLLTFHIIIELELFQSLGDSNYLSSGVPLYVINGEPFNFLGMLFQKVKDQYMLNPLVIFYYLFNLLNYILIVSASVFYMMERLKHHNFNAETEKIRECYICSEKAHMLLEEEIQARDKKVGQSTVVSREKNHHIKEHYFSLNDGVRKLYEKSVAFIPERERAELMNEILQGHINLRHNIFTYISYFCYLLDKKKRYLTGKEKMIKERFENKDFEVYH